MINIKNIEWRDWIVSIILFPLCIYFTLRMGKFNFIDYFNLLIHEGGHGVFRFFGDFIYTLGGTLMQIIIPFLFIYYFIKIHRLFALQIALVWLGENLMNIFVYVADARTQKLPLLGGKKVYHDWHWLLSRIDLLEFDKEIGLFFYITGIIVFVIALILPYFFINYRDNYEN